MALSDTDIRKAIREGQLIIRPLGVVNPAGIDLRTSKLLTLDPHKHALAATMEHLQLPNTLAGILHLRSSLAREGLIASLALVDPGYKGQLTISLYNAAATRVKLKQGERFIQLSLLKLTTPAEKTYNGKYQNSRGAIASKRRRKILLA